MIQKSTTIIQSTFIHLLARFMESEVQLDEELSRFQSVATEPTLLTMLSRSSKWHQTFLPLLQHDNEDIAARVVSLLQEMTEMDEDITPQEYDGLWEFCEGLLANGLLSLLLERLQRVDEAVEGGSDIVYKALAIMENFVDVDVRLLESTSAAIWHGWNSYLVNRFSSPGLGSDQNRFYALELTSILACSAPLFRLAFLASADGIDKILGCIAQFKVTGDPKSADEQEYFENLFDLLCNLILEADGLEHFIACQGIDLILLLIKETTMVRVRGLRVLAFALTDRDSVAQTADAVINALGLKVLCPILMRKGTQTLRKAYPHYFSEIQDSEYIASIFSALLRFSSGQSLKRVEGKFEENDGEKVTALLELHSQLTTKGDEAMTALRQVDLVLILVKSRKLVGLGQVKAFQPISKEIKTTLTSWAESLTEEAPEEKGYFLQLCTCLK